MAIDLPACVASNAQMVRLRHVLEMTALLPLFDPHVFGADLVQRVLSPPLDLFLFAAEHMGTAPARCLVVEDSVTGIQAARAAGMRVVGFHGGGHCFPGYEQRLTAAKCCDAFLTAQAFKHDADFIVGGMMLARVARRMSLITCSAAGFCSPVFCLIFASFE